MYHLILFCFIPGQLLSIQMLSPSSIYPCLDSYDIIIVHHNLSLSNLDQLIRIYSTNKLNNHLRDYHYEQEVKIPQNNLLKLDCNIFVNDFDYYCFVFVALFKINGSILINTDPVCKPLLSNHLNLSAPLNLNFEISKLSSHGSSFKVENSDPQNDDQVLIDHYIDLIEGQNEVKPDIFLNCRCDDLITVNASQTVIVQSFNCDPDATSLNCFYPLETLASFPSSCVLNFTQPNLLIKIKVVKYECNQNQDINTFVDPLLIIRNGISKNDPQIDINDHSSLFQLNSLYLKIESVKRFNYMIKVIIYHPEPPPQTNLWFYLSLDWIHWTFIAFIACSTLSILILIIILCLTKKRQTKVQIITIDEEQVTCTSFLDASSISHFSFETSESLEMDYYDYSLKKEELN